jgi:SAM-dependent methyltransferase
MRLTVRSAGGRVKVPWRRAAWRVCYDAGKMTAMSLRHHEIAEANHRILNPFTESQLRLLGEVSGVDAATRILDLACGKGELLCRWAAWFGSGGLGVDISTVFVPAAVARAAELGVDDRVSFVEADASTFAPEPAGFDIAACIGATWIGNGIAGTIDLLRPALRPGGRILIGEPYWIDPPPPEVVTALGFGPADDFSSLVGTLDRIEAAGLELVEMVLANQDSWDRYVAAQWRTVTAWLAARPDDPDHAAMREFRDRERRAHLEYGRRYLGWGVFVTQPREGSSGG